MRFLRWKYGLEEPPAEVRPVTLEEVERENELIEKVLTGKMDVSARKEAPRKGPGCRTFNVFVGEEYYTVEVEEEGARPKARAAGNTAPIVKKGNGEKKKEAAGGGDEGKPSGDGSEFTLIAPMPGMVISYEVKEGDKVGKGDVLVILEAMKMQNSLTSSVEGTISSIKVSPGTSVEKNQVLLTISS